MRRAPASGRIRLSRGIGVFLAGLVASVPAARSSPLEFLPVGDPLEAELRVLETLGPPPGVEFLPLARLGTRPLQRGDLDSLAGIEAAAGSAHSVSLLRLRRSAARENPERFAEPVAGATPRLLQRRYPDGSRFELSAGAEGRATLAAGRVRWAPSSGLHGRVGFESDRWLVFTHLVAGHQDTARTYADPIFPASNIIVYTDDTYLAYTGARGRWSVQVGRTRWHWGPGEEGSLLLSRSAVAMTGVALHARIEPLRADAMALSATLRDAAGEQLAAHRLEWQPLEALRFGLSEAARYQAEAWRPLYLVGVVPYILVQRLQVQDDPASAGSLRNNIMVGADVAWRVAPGTRLYAEWLADDLHLSSGSDLPSKYAWQVGWDGVGRIGGTRMVWGGEYTRLTRFVYTSFFGRDHVAQGRALGFPFAPDAGRLRVRAAWDLSADWQLTALASRTEKGENSLAEPFVPGSPEVDAAKFEGVVEETREIEAGVRWWPSAGVDVSLSAGHRWVDDAAHVAGARVRDAFGTLSVRLTR